MCNIFKIICLGILIFLIPISYEKSIADNIDVVDKQIIKVRFNLQNKRREKIVGINFIKIPKHRIIEDKGIIYKDVLEYSKQEPFGDDGGRNINVHETAHGIHSDLRNEYQKKLGYELNALYCLDGNIILIREPSITMRHVMNFVPEKLRSYRWKLYFVQQLSDWNDKPTYILDEWISYILGSKCAVDDHQKGINTHKSDAVSGCLDFSIYSVAFAMAVKKHDPEYWNNNPDFKETIRYHLIQAEKTLGQGLDISAFNSVGQDELYNNLLNDPNSEELREFILTEFDGIFIK